MLIQSMCSCSCQCSTTIMKRMKQDTLFGFLVLNVLLIIPCLSDWFASHHTLCLQEYWQEWFVHVTQRVLQLVAIMETAHPRGWLATQSTPPPPPPPPPPSWISPWFYPWFQVLCWQEVIIMELITVMSCDQNLYNLGYSASTVYVALHQQLCMCKFASLPPNTWIAALFLPLIATDEFDY